jgi:hypothetical protein
MWGRSSVQNTLQTCPNAKMVMKELALVGFAELTRELWRTLPPGIEIWSSNQAWAYDIPVTRLLDIHPIEWLRVQGDNPAGGWAAEHWQRLTAGMGMPVYMLHKYRKIPGSVRYPVEKVLAKCKRFFFTSSCAWLIGLAILEGYERIYAYGYDMRSDSEYGYQRESVSWLIGLCDGLGIDLVLPSMSALCNAKLYGYEAQQMISRMILEGHLKSYQSQREEWIGRANVYQGILEERKRLLAEATNGNRPELEALAKASDDDRKRALRVVYGIEGAIQAMQHLIDNCDMAEVDTTIADKLRTVDLRMEKA